MENVDFLSLFQGFGTMVAGGWVLAVARVFLITRVFRLERSFGTYGNDPYGIRYGCDQLWYADDA